MTGFEDTGSAPSAEAPETACDDAAVRPFPQQARQAPARPATPPAPALPGVVSLPFGWGHNQSKTKLSIANQHAGPNMNDIVDDEFYDQLSGSSALGGIPVNITSVKPE